MICEVVAYFKEYAGMDKDLTSEERERLACATHLGLNPSQISEVKTVTDVGGHFVGLDVRIRISTGRQLDQWIKDHLPK